MFSTFLERYFLKGIQVGKSAVLQRKAIVKAAGGLGKLCVQGLTPSPSSLVSKPEKRAEDTEAA